jgi:hypothetical protein
MGGWLLGQFLSEKRTSLNKQRIGTPVPLEIDMSVSDLRLEPKELRALGFEHDFQPNVWHRGHVSYYANYGTWWRDGWQFHPQTVADLRCDKAID